MISIDTVLVKLASRCNLDCDYCYVYRMGDDAWKLQPKLISRDTVQALGRNLARLVSSQGRPLSIVFHGGEPLLIGARRFEEICADLRRELPSPVGLHVQTNGLLLTDAVIDICARHDVGISISLDGPASIHDRHRLDRRGRASHHAVMAAIARVLSHPKGDSLLTGLLCVIDLNVDPRDVYAFFKTTGTASVDFLYRDGNHDVLPVGKSSILSTEYGDWMVRLLDTYLVDASPIRIRLLDDMLRLILGGRAVKEGVGDDEYGILVVETDGSITKNDTLKSAGGTDRFDGAWSVHDDIVDLVTSSSFETYHREQRPSSPTCLSCPDLTICGGGMPAHRWSAANGLDNPSVFCADQKRLIERMRTHLSLGRAA
ncbi:radical SAM protein [Sphingomonas sp. RHCKR7]|uniref:cyclophane-forming radical SAM/SPASM peptide maturase YhhB n=1 Tax=Sphingomonas folli TaxID=2862497 RepID=UPI001CA47ABB|nr:cyclophane-forming radical SAM/SPASM peptide maturase YhhB [Sphingomonas folli]MBW6525236.1 radical SAM protein [Sphingomonas folli]